MFNIIQELNVSSSINYKLEVLTKHKDNELLKKILSMAMDTVKYNYYIRKYPVVTQSIQSLSLEEALEILLSLPRGLEGIRIVTDTLSRLSKEDVYVIERILDRDLKCGIGRTIVNKVFPNLITKPPYMRCSVYSDNTIKKIKFPAILQEKYDGLYQMVEVNEGKVTFTSRSGEEREFPKLANSFMKMPNGIYMGELLVRDISNRAESNGIINSDSANDYPIHMLLWDYLHDFTDSLPYSERFKLLYDIINLYEDEYIGIVDSYKINSIQEALQITSVLMQEGKEGTILKDYSNIFKSHTSPTQLKLKLEIDTTVRIIGFTDGTIGTKREGKVGAIIFSTDDGKVQGQTSGFTDKQLEYITSNKNSLLNTLIDVTFNDLTKARDNAHYALSHPRFKSFRDDITETDTLERIFELRDMAMQLT